MANFRLLAHPWWVNLLLLVPLVAYFLFRREKPQLTSRELLISAMFALSFGFVEGAVAIYLGVAVGLLSGHAGPLSDVARLSADLHGQQSQPLNNLPPSLLRVEGFREAASMLMLLVATKLGLVRLAEEVTNSAWLGIGFLRKFGSDFAQMGIGIGGRVTSPPLPHHRTCGSASGGSAD